MSDSNARDLYALPVVNVSSSDNKSGINNTVDLRASGKLNGKNNNINDKDSKANMVKSQYVQEDEDYGNDRKNRRQKRMMDSIK